MKTKNSGLIENLFLGLLALFFLFEALKLYLYYPYTDNEGAFVLIGREMCRGAQLYADIWDHKPPFLFGQSWLLQLLFPLTEIHLHLYALFIHGLNAFLIFRVARRLEFSPGGAWASVFGYLFLLFPPLFQLWAVEADLLIQPFLLLSFWAAFSKKGWINFLSGGLWTTAFFTKQSALFILPVYLMAGAFSDIPKILKWMTGAGLVVLAVVLKLGWDGRLIDFYAALIGFNQYYIEKGWLFFFGTPAFRDFLVQWTRVAGLTYGLAFLIWGMSSVGKLLKSVHPRTSFFLVVWLLGVLASCGVSGYFFTYYFIELLPPLALGLGLAWMKWQETHRKDLAVGFGLMALGVLMIATNTGDTRDKIFAYAQYSPERYFADKSMGMFIASEAKPGDELLSWNDDPQIYVYSGLKPFLKTPFINHLSGMPYEAAKVFNDFINRPPRFCVISRMSQVIAPPDGIIKALTKNYVLVKSLGDLDLYRLR